jgi:hypothetical protein
LDSLEEERDEEEYADFGYDIKDRYYSEADGLVGVSG